VKRRRGKIRAHWDLNPRLEIPRHVEENRTRAGLRAAQSKILELPWTRLGERGAAAWPGGQSVPEKARNKRGSGRWPKFASRSQRSVCFGWDHGFSFTREKATRGGLLPPRGRLLIRDTGTGQVGRFWRETVSLPRGQGLGGFTHRAGGPQPGPRLPVNPGFRRMRVADHGSVFLFCGL